MRDANNPLGNGKQTGVLMISQTEKSWNLSVCGGFATMESGQTWKSSGVGRTRVFSGME